MASRGCEREPELLTALGSGHWPAGPGEELRAHVTGCALCSELAAVATALLEDRRTALESAPVPGSGLVWWRMQLRARREESRAAARVLSFAHAAAIAGSLAVALVFLGATLMADPIATPPRIGDALRDGTLAAASLRIFLPWAGPILLGLVAWLVLAPVAVWLAVTDE